jgi:hypothetical protein
MPVNATRFLRKMRGGAQAHLLATDSPERASSYVTKFFDNPQHRRILVNEWLCAHLLAWLQVATPKVTIVSVSEDFLRDNPEVHYQLGSGRVPVSPGWHLGSQFPGQPQTDAVYDFLPDSLLPQVVNVDDFRGALVFDKWVGNSDARQAIFFRRRIRDWLDRAGVTPQQKGFIAQMIDHGYAFDGPHWTFSDSPLQGLYFRALAYRGVRGMDDLQPWLDRVRYFPESVIDAAWRQMPPRWVEQDEAELERLLTRLLKRRQSVADLIAMSVAARPNVFPDWLR